MEKNLYRVMIPLLFSASAAFAGGPDIIIEPDYFTGLFIGGIGSIKQTTFNTNSSALVPNAVTFTLPPFPDIPIAPTINPSTPIQAGSYLQYNGGGGGFSGYGGIQGGIGKVFIHHLYIGAVGWGEWGNQSNTSTVSTASSGEQIMNVILGDPFDRGSSTNFATSTTKVTLENNYGVAARLGYTVTPSTLIYGKIGAIWSQLKISNDTSLTRTINFSGESATLEGNFTSNATLSGSSNNSQTKNALVTGLGLEQFIYKDIASINIEYNYADFGTITTTTPLFLTGQATETLSLIGEETVRSTVSTRVDNAATHATATASSKVKVSTLLLGIDFHFGQGWF